ncbi:serine-threonine protein kinase 19-domain-containing protein [Chaetomium strumarium]|uniref:Serine-threonine protein kinase 19-domain-containing protein n=1 Tax=Chaetomium strumarium TaxID=1170767 RepID=A0AAJ0H1N6_9PEZI|nr:serine-threonine protein kinase 19-domain-containing protein [Chaetomium strumarium]
MTQSPSLRSILGGSRVKKRTSSANKRSSSSWTSTLAQTKPGAAPSKLLVPPQSPIDPGHGRSSEENPGPSPPPALLPSAATNSNPTSSSSSSSTPLPSSRNPTLQIHQHILDSMFDPFPPNLAGLGSARIAAAARFRAAFPPLVSVAHLQAQLLLLLPLATTTTPGAPPSPSPSPAAAERAMAALVRAGLARKIVIPTLRRVGGRAGELFISSEALGRMVEGAAGLGAEVKEIFGRWLRDHPAAVRISRGELGGVVGLGAGEVDALVRAGFLTAGHEQGSGGGGKGLYARPEERYAMISLEAVARAAAGSVAAVGGERVLHAAGGTGARSMGGSGAVAGEFSVAVPGSGVFLKLASAAVEHLAELLHKTQHREMSESDLREKWDGGVVGSSDATLAKKARGEFAGVMPGRTKKWKQFHGLAFGWVLQEAVGAGLVEVFDTRSVGRGVRLV